MPNLSRRHLVTTAAALPVLALPSAAHSSACTLPPDLIERFLRMRAWFLEDHARYSLQSREHDKRFEAATGVTTDEYRDMEYEDPRSKELRPTWEKTFNEVRHESGQTDEDVEGDRLHAERWDVAEAMMAHKPQTIVDLAWQLEAWLIADCELLGSGSDCTSDWLSRTFLEHVRTLGALPQPADPFNGLRLRVEA